MRDQASNLRRQLHSKEAKTLAIVSGKGGVDKSNIALNFSLELIRQQKKVLLFDLDVGMGNIDILLGLHAEKTIVDMFNEQLSIHNIIKTGPESLAYIAGVSGSSDFFAMNQENRDYFFTQYQELTQFYDYIIFDIGVGVPNDSIFFILASDECIVITTPEPSSITDAYSMVKHVVANQSYMPIHVVINRSATQRDGERALERFKNVVYQFLHVEIQMLGIIPEDKIVSTAVRRQIPYVLLNEKSAVSKAIKQLVRNYTTKTIEVNKIGSASFVQKLKQIIAER